MYSKEKVMEVVNYVLSGKNVTQTAQHFGKSRPTINSILDKVRKEGGDYYDEVLSEKLKLTLKKLLLEARSNAGAKSKREIVISDEQASEIANKLYIGFTLRALAEEYNCSHTTIANAFIRVADRELLAKMLKQARNIKEKEHLESMLALLENEDVISQMPSQEAYNEIQNMYRGK